MTIFYIKLKITGYSVFWGNSSTTCVTVTTWKKNLEFFHDTLCYNIDIRLINEKQVDDNSEDLNVLDCKSDNEGMDASTDEEEAALDKLHQ